VIGSSVVRVAVVGDLHIGAPVRGLDAPQSNEDAREFAYFATERLIETVSEVRPDAVLITGDLFDRSDNSGRALGLAQRLVDEWSDRGRPLAVIGGNHDAESELPARVHLPISARWFSAERPESFSLPDLGLAVHGVSVRERDDLRQMIGDYPDPVAGAFNIAMLHSSLDGEWSNRACLPVPLDQLRGDRRYDAWALGHVHRRLTLNGGPLGGGPLIAYPGGVHAKRDSSDGARGFMIFEIERDNTIGENRTRARIAEVDVALAGRRRFEESHI
jgi:exonuclease SbcD